MADKTGIGWTEATWNPTTGCDRISAGCDHCHALQMAGRLKLMGSPKYQNDGDPRTSGPGFGVTILPSVLDQPNAQHMTDSSYDPVLTDPRVSYATRYGHRPRRPRHARREPPHGRYRTRLAQQRDTQRPDAPPNTPRAAELGRTTGPQAASEAEPGRTMLVVTGDGKDAQTVTTDGPVTGLGEPRTDKRRSWTTQAIADAINRNPLRTGRQPEHSNVTDGSQKTQAVTTHGRIISMSEPKTGTAAAQAVLDAINTGQIRSEQLDDCGFWTAKAAQQHRQAETETDHSPEREP